MHIMADGRFQIRLGRNKQSEPEVEYPPDLDHFAKFADAVRMRDPKLLESEIEETAISTGLCHLGNISYRVKSELQFDPQRLRFIGHDRREQTSHAQIPRPLHRARQSLTGLHCELPTERSNRFFSRSFAEASMIFSASAPASKAISMKPMCISSQL